MRCLHCGSTLSAFKKFTDGDFCSAEHRDGFYAEQQRLILDRLKQAAGRFQRLRTPIRAAALTRTPVVSVPAEPQPPAPIAAFLLPKLEPGTSPLRLLCLSALGAELSPPTIPQFSVASAEKGRQRFCSLAPDLPWPRYNPGLLWYSELLLDASETPDYLPSLGALGFAPSLAFPAPGLLLSRRPDIANRPTIARRMPLRVARPKGAVSLAPVRLATACSRLIVGGYGFQPLRGVSPIVPTALRPFLGATPLEIGPSRQPLAESVRFHQDVSVKGMSFLDRIYRMRPRYGVASEAVPVMRVCNPEPLPASLSVAQPGAALSGMMGFEPAQVEKFVRSRPRGPLGASTPSQLHLGSSALPATGGMPAISVARPMPGTEVRLLSSRVNASILGGTPVSAETAASSGVEPGSPIWSASPAFPSSENSPATEPTRVERLFRARPRAVLAETLCLATEELAMHSQAAPNPSYPTSEPEFGPAPRRVDRFFRPRPRGPVDCESAYSETERTKTELPQATPSLPAAKLQELGSCAPSAVVRFFRPRPRGPVTAELPEMASVAAAPENWPAGATVASLPAPPLRFEVPAVATLFRARPRSAVAAGSSSELTGSSAPETLLSRPAAPQLDAVLNAAPAAVTRMFRMRPRAGVDCATALIVVPDLQPCASSDTAVSNPASGVPALTAEVAFLDRMYRSRPRTAVARATSDCKWIAPGEPASAASSIPVPPTFTAATLDLAPGPSQRIFRSRPRTGVLDSALASSLAPSTAVEALQSRPASPGLALCACEPLFLDRMFRMRPRNGVGHDTTAPMMWIATAPKALPGNPAGVGLPPRLAGDFAPRSIERMYRGRPRAGVLSPDLASFCSTDLSFASFPAKPAAVLQVLPDCAPGPVVRLVRVRPKAAVDASTSLMAASIESLAFPDTKPEFMPDWWDVLYGAKPAFVNKMYRMRLKNPAQDEETVMREIRTKHVPTAEPEPVLATLPQPASSAAPSFLDRLYRMRPKGGKSAIPAANPIPCDAMEPKVLSGAPASVLDAVSKQWKAAPIRIKSLAATLPILLLMALFPWGAPTVAAENPIRHAMVERAAIQRTADFVQGIDQWRGAERWTLTPSGAIEPNGLALFEPSLNMRNYRLAFRTRLHKGGVGFVVRATDERNYQAIKLKIVKPGPLPVVRIVRWTVIDGVESGRREIPLPMNVTADTQYRIALDANDQSFTLMVQDKLVDFWSEEQLKSGGAGFFGDKGDRATIHSVQMTHQDDAIGKLFAALTLRERSSN
ncbi:MAG TPA: hypothetical protein VER03_06315 [Bryobacteraceae bacterium]|nr:hypothetical protein [Bryobacteraceae bacterium]